MHHHCPEIHKHFLDFNKRAWENSLKSIALFQEQTETLINGLFEQINWLPEEGRRIADDIFAISKQSLHNYKTYMDQQYRKLLEIFPETDIQR